MLGAREVLSALREEVARLEAELAEIESHPVVHHVTFDSTIREVRNGLVEFDMGPTIIDSMWDALGRPSTVTVAVARADDLEFRIRFPLRATACCSAHGKVACPKCSRSRDTNSVDERDNCRECSTYAESGMHWDTCPERVR